MRQASRLAVFGHLQMRMKRTLFLVHRWLGIPLCLLFLLWFVSGVVMMYARAPALDADERLQGMAVIDADRIVVTPAQALANAGLSEAPQRLRLVVQQQRPIYFILPKGQKWIGVHADDGSLLPPTTADQAVQIAQRYVASPLAPEFIATLDSIDQWTLSNSLNLHRPLHKLAINDPAATELYVSQITGEVMVMNTALDRLLGYLGTLTHYGEFLFIREHVGIWRQMMIWLAVLGTLLATTGIIVGIMRYRQKGYRLRGSRVVKTPYRGWMKWHHVIGLVFGAMTLTWIFSGMLYLNPTGSRNPNPLDTQTTMSPYNVGGVRANYSATAAQAAAFTGGALDPAQFTVSPQHALQRAGREFPAREVELIRFAGRPYYLSWDTPYNSRLIAADDPAAASFVQFDSALLIAKAREALPEASITATTMLTRYDSQYYAVGSVLPKRLPVLRVSFDDPQATTLYIDPHRGSVVRRVDSYGRFFRYLMYALHCWDYPLLVLNRPLWDIVVILLCLGGSILSISGIVIGYRRLAPPAK